MTTYNVYIYRELRLGFGDIEADSHEAAASIARDLPTEEADSIDDCEGKTMSALVDVAGDEDYEQSRMIDFESERQSEAAPELLELARQIVLAKDTEESVPVDLYHAAVRIIARIEGDQA